MFESIVPALERNDGAVTRQDCSAAFKAVQFAALNVNLQVVEPLPIADGNVKRGYVNPDLSRLGSFWKIEPATLQTTFRWCAGRFREGGVALAKIG